MIVASMEHSEYNFKRCKLCKELSAEPTYHLTDSTIYCCRKCDFHFLNRLDWPPSPPDKTIKLDHKRRTYIESRLDENAHLHLNRLKCVQHHFNLSGCQALDIGAGLGQFQRLLEAQGAEAIGIEPSMIRRDYTLEAFGITLRPELVDADYWQKGFHRYFDLITLWDVIEHVDFPRETLAAASKLLKPGGMLFLDTPSREVLSYRLSQWYYQLFPGKVGLFLPSFYSTARYGHKQIFTRQQLAELFKSVDLQIIFSARSYTGKPFSSSKIILAGRKIEPA